MTAVTEISIKLFKELAMSSWKIIGEHVMRNCFVDKNPSNNERSLKTEETEWLDSKGAAQYLKISEATLRNKVSNGLIPYYKLGRSNRYSKAELIRVITSERRGK